MSSVDESEFSDVASFFGGSDSKKKHGQTGWYCISNIVVFLHDCISNVYENAFMQIECVTKTKRNRSEHMFKRIAMD